MKQFKKKYRKLYKSFSARLRKLNKQCIEGTGSIQEYFKTYLVFLRDCMILQSPPDRALDEKDPVLASLVLAITEYEDYEEAIYKYYSLNQAKVPNALEGDASLSKYQEDAFTHREAFWNLVKFYIEDWLQYVCF